ncbi:MAG: hypothetical protein JSR96_14030 [Proteobacteria bacterium]|nr:hypothetical protein [Pseudomonadota bacterium]
MRQTSLILVCMLTAGCEKSHQSAPPPQQMFQSNVGSLSAADITFLRAETSIFGAEQIRFFEDPENAQYRDQLQKNLLESRSCVRKFQGATPELDAQTEISKNNFDLYVARRNGVASYLFVPSIENCQFPIYKIEGFENLNNPAAGDGQHFWIVDRCDDLMVRYASRYNREMVKKFPRSLILSCGGSKRARLTPEDKAF